MKNQWNQFPFVLRRKILLTFLAGLASIALSLIIFIITTDHILLVLGSIIFLASLVLVRRRPVSFLLSNRQPPCGRE